MRPNERCDVIGTPPSSMPGVGLRPVTFGRGRFTNGGRFTNRPYDGWHRATEGQGPVAGRLTTHVLDTARGRPAAGLAVELWRVEGDERALVRSVVTDGDGRTDGPLLEGEELTTGVYELVFAVGEYFAGQVGVGGVGGGQPFLDRVPVRFGVAEPGAHYHVPLLVSPWAYSTYRGS